jgi:hypothetical protein
MILKYLDTEALKNSIFYICGPPLHPQACAYTQQMLFPDGRITSLMTTLKGGKMIKIAVDENGTAVSGKPQELSAQRTVTVMLPLILMEVPCM